MIARSCRLRTASGSLGGFIGGTLGGPIIARFGVFVDAAAMSALALAVTWAFAPGLITEAHHEEGGAPKPKFAWPKGAAIFILGFMALFCMIPEGGVLDWSALYLSKELGAGVAVSGLSFGLFSAAMAAMRFVGDSVRNRFGAVATMRASAAVAAVGVLGAALAPDPWWAIAAFALAGVGIANTVPIAFSAAGAQPGLSPGAGISIVTMMGYTGIIAAPSVIGFVAQTRWLSRDVCGDRGVAAGGDGAREPGRRGGPQRERRCPGFGGLGEAKPTRFYS